MRDVIVAAVLVASACSPEGEPKRQQAPAPGAADTVSESIRNAFKLLAIVRDSEPAQYQNLRAMAIMGAQMGLASLGYGTRFTGELDRETQAAVRAYQRDRGLPETGNLLDTLTMDLIGREEEAVHRAVTSVRPGPKVFRTVFWERGYFSASGGWRSTNKKLWATVQAVELQCERPAGQCRMMLAQITGRQLNVSDEVYAITSWDNVEIRARTIPAPAMT